MPTLIVAGHPVRAVCGTVPPSLLYETRLAKTAPPAGWNFLRPAQDDIPDDVPDPVVYVVTELAVATAAALNLALLEPPFDLLARVPERFLRRRVEAASFGALAGLRQRTFVKP